MKHRTDQNTLPVIKKDELTVLWDSPIHTDRNIQANKPDIVVKDEKKESVLWLISQYHQTPT